MPIEFQLRETPYTILSTNYPNLRDVYFLEV